MKRLFYSSKFVDRKALFNQGKAVHWSHVMTDDIEDAIAVVCTTMRISMPFITATPIIGVKFHFHSFRFVYLSAFCTRWREE